MAQIRRIAISLILGFVVYAAAKECVFIHGAGIMPASRPTPSYTDYWGNVHLMTPQCSNWTFMHLDETNQRFDDMHLMRQICGELSRSGDYWVRDRVIFTHSMGNVALAAAIRHGICDLDTNSVDWYTIGSPTFGSKAADWAQTFCSDQSIFTYVIREIAARFHFCDTSSTVQAFVSIMTTDPEVSPFKTPNLAEIMGQRVKGSMCGNNAYGLNSIDSLGLQALSLLINFGEDNDGMVALSVCQALGEAAMQYRREKFGENLSWGTTPDSPFYLASVNHADETCRFGNGAWGTDRQPCSWYTYATARSVNAEHKLSEATHKRLKQGLGEAMKEQAQKHPELALVD